MPFYTSIKIKEGTICISPHAFSGCSNLMSIAIPNSVTSIGIQAFYIVGSLSLLSIITIVLEISFYVYFHWIL